MWAARSALRSSAIRRSIHTTRTSSNSRSSWTTSGAVLVAGVVTYAAYHAWDIDSRRRIIALEEKVPQKKPPAETAPKEARKATDNTSVDTPAPAKPSPSEPGVIKPSGEAPAPTPAVGSDPPVNADDPPANAEDPPADGDEEEKERAANQGAYNPETGEINWDCPCLGGMAHGPCGPQFREAFSCFVYSNEEPKGVDCVEKFKAMQDCFREHPDVYGEEIDEEEEDEPVEETERPSDQDQTNDTKPKSTPELNDRDEEQKDTPSGVSSPPKSDDKTQERKDTPPGTPSRPSKAPPSRQNAPTANVSPENTATKRDKTH